VSRKSEASAQRRERVEAMRREQQAKERRRGLIVIGGSVLVALAILAAAAVPVYTSWRDNPVNRAWSDFGVSATAAQCQAAVDDATTGSSDHRDQGALTYSTAPPSSGPHRSMPDALTRRFYPPGDGIEVEQLVHNLEHGYTVLWYDPTASEADRADLEALAQKVTEDEALAKSVAKKFKVAAWDTSRGDFPDGATIALSHWGKDKGSRQYCGRLSGEVVRDFVQAHPYTDSPEPGGA
jgi:hypothetical protein